MKTSLEKKLLEQRLIKRRPLEKKLLKSSLGRFLFLWVGLLSLNRCSTSSKQPLPVPTPPALTFVPHPEGTDIGDVAHLFRDPQSPPWESFTKDCDAAFQKLVSLTVSKDELEAGVGELVHSDSVHYHWCFYGKLLSLERSLSKEELYLDERQKLIFSAYKFLTPIARAFLHQFHDSRYLRWAMNKYEQYSERYFFRKLEITARGTAELVEASAPLGLVRDPKTKHPILEKYHLVATSPDKLESPVPATIPAEVPAAPMATPSSSPVPTPDVTLSPAVVQTPAPVPVPTMTSEPVLVPSNGK